MICHTTRSQLPQTHKKIRFGAWECSSFYELQGQRDDLQRGPDGQAAKSSRPAPPVALLRHRRCFNDFPVGFSWGSDISNDLYDDNFSVTFFPGG